MPHAPRLSRKNVRLLQRALRTPQPCLLCGGAPMYAALFWPQQPALWGGTPGKARVCAYRLCAHCYALPEKGARVEARLMPALVGRRN